MFIGCPLHRLGLYAEKMGFHTLIRPDPRKGAFAAGFKRGQFVRNAPLLAFHVDGPGRAYPYPRCVGDMGDGRDVLLCCDVMLECYIAYNITISDVTMCTVSVCGDGVPVSEVCGRYGVGGYTIMLLSTTHIRVDSTVRGARMQ